MSAAIPTTKTETKRLLAAERKAARQKVKAVALRAKIRGIYRQQVNRATEYRQTLPYTIDEFESHVSAYLDAGGCPYCGQKLTLKSFCCDHAFPLSRGGSFALTNVCVACKPCNLRKGMMTHTEYAAFVRFVTRVFPATVVTDLFRRLVAGGKYNRLP